MDGGRRILPAPRPNGGIPYSTLSTMQKSQTVTLATVYAICIGFGMTLSQFFDSDLFAEEAISD